MGKASGRNSMSQWLVNRNPEFLLIGSDLHMEFKSLMCATMFFCYYMCKSRHGQYHQDLQTLGHNNTRNMRHTSTYIWLSNLVTMTQTKTNDPSMPTENGTQNHPCHTTRSSTMRRLEKKHRHERCFQPSRETYGNGAATSRGWTTTDGHTSSPCGTPEKAEGTWDDKGRDGLTNSKELRVTNGPEV